MPTASAAGARRAQPNEAALQHNPRSPADNAQAADPRIVWQAEQSVVPNPQSEPTTRQEESLVVGDRTPANRWVRFAWEPLAVEPREQHRGRNSPIPAAGGFSRVANGGVGVGVGVGDGRVPGASGPTPVQGLSGSGSRARQGQENIGVKRFRASVGVFGEETEQTDSSFGGLGSVVPADRTVWGHPQTESWPRRHRCPQRRAGFEASGAAGQTGRGVTLPNTGNAFSMARRGLVGAAEAVTLPLAGRHGHAPLLAAADSRDGSERIARGINARPSGWGRGGHVHAMAEEEVQAGGNGANSGVTPYRAAPTYRKQRQEQGERYERGSSAKKPRYNGLSVGQMDTLTDGVGSLGVASPEATSNGDPPEPGGGAPRRRGHVSRRETLTGSTHGAFLPEPARPALAIGGVGRAYPRAACASAGAQSCAMMRRQKAQSGTETGGPGQHQSKRHRNGSLAAGASLSFR